MPDATHNNTSLLVQINSNALEKQHQTKKQRTADFFWLCGATNMFCICIMAAIVTISLEQPKFPDSSSILANMGLSGNSAIRTPMGSVRRPYWSRPARARACENTCRSCSSERMMIFYLRERRAAPGPGPWTEPGEAATQTHWCSTTRSGRGQGHMDKITSRSFFLYQSITIILKIHVKKNNLFKFIFAPMWKL